MYRFNRYSLLFIYILAIFSIYVIFDAYLRERLAREEAEEALDSFRDIGTLELEGTE